MTRPVDYLDDPDWGDGLGDGHHRHLCSQRCPACRPLPDAASCPPAAACESCAAVAGLDVLEADTPVGVVCLTLCGQCAELGRTPRMGLPDAARRAIAHHQHTEPPANAPRDPVALAPLGAVWSDDFDAYAAGQIDASQVTCALCMCAPCRCPAFGTEAYFRLLGWRHGRHPGR